MVRQVTTLFLNVWTSASTISSDVPLMGLASSTNRSSETVFLPRLRGRCRARTACARRRGREAADCLHHLIEVVINVPVGHSEDAPAAAAKVCLSPRIVGALRFCAVRPPIDFNDQLL